MELRHIKYFLALAEELSFIKAADKLFISQPPLSRQIKELEDELGTRLFHRNNKRVELTEAGKYFEKEARQLLQSLERIALKTQKIGNNISGEFRIAYISSTFSGHITELIKYLSAQYPYVNFRLYEVSTSRQIAALEQGKLDLGIIRGPLKSPHLRIEQWFQDSFSLVFNMHRIKITTEEEMRSLSNETFIFFNKDHSPYYYETLLQLCAAYGFEPRVTHESNNVNSILQLISDGLGSSILPTSFVKNNQLPDVGHIEITAANQFSEVLLAYFKDNLSEITEKAISFLQGKITE
ncbi:LysR family transcriptional regulator [Solitalea longa]|uniref:LysR family transcriptional regulator n=1 Tax=Solitalea longa TaxID=2079460 RepID=A0A2S5AAV0_9SPHI|nr:LysR family transcriptional regulator [Solitalea longa]POY39367.1 LysR family transcriptional regulator [Solitalea longa]